MPGRPRRWRTGSRSGRPGTGSRVTARRRRTSPGSSARAGRSSRDAGRRPVAHRDHGYPTGYDPAMLTDRTPKSSDESDEARAFLQARVALFWKVLFFFMLGASLLGSIS